MSEIKGYECRHAISTISKCGKHDLMTIKEIVHFDDGTKQVRMVNKIDEPRYFWVTKKAYQDHKEKLEWEHVDRLQRYTATTATINERAAAAVGHFGSTRRMEEIARSPYLYGLGIKPTVIAKQRYMDKYPDCITPVATMAVLDIETDMETNEIILISLTMKKRVYTAILRRWIGESFEKDVGALVTNRYNELLPGQLDARGIDQPVFEVFDTPGQMCKAVIDQAHDWKPDFINIWNIDFDLKRHIIPALENEGYDLGDVFSDPTVPKPFRQFAYVEGKNYKFTQDGDRKTLAPSEQWHTVNCPASFYFLDAMCLYRRIRTGQSNLPDYKLDTVLDIELGSSKLHFEPRLPYSNDGQWHAVMQKYHKIEYIVYNIVDCIRVEELDEKTKDTAQTFPGLCGRSDYSEYKSNPTKICNSIFFMCAKKGYIMSTPSDTMRTEMDNHIASIKGWIVTLPAFCIAPIGLNAYTQMPGRITMIYAHASDLDIASTYPTGQMICNISRETTTREFSKTQGYTENQQRAFGINLTGGISNSIELCVTMLGAPTPEQLLSAYLKTRK